MPAQRGPTRWGARTRSSTRTTPTGPEHYRDDWTVPLVAIEREPARRVGRQLEGRIGSLEVAGTVLAGGRAALFVELSRLLGVVEVRGRLTGAWKSQCRRCLREIEGPLSVDVREIYSEDVAGSEEAREELYPLGRTVIDLAPLARDAVLLNLPLAPVCDEGCKGLCSRCGADLNYRDCGCPPVSGDPRWAALEELKSAPPASPPPSV